MESLSPTQARKLILLSQGLPPSAAKGTALQASFAAIERIGYVQIDTISVIERAHHHTLWNRNRRYQTKHLEQLLQSHDVFEYWSHAAAYLPMRDFRFSLVRKQAIKSGEQDHWYERDLKMQQRVLDRIHDEGPLMAKDFDNGGEQTSDWNSKPAKRALEYLFMQGDLMVPRRSAFHKVYDLTERVLPAGVDTALPSEDEYLRFLITRFLQANGLGLEREMRYLLKSMQGKLAPILDRLYDSGELQLVAVAGQNYYALNEQLALLDKPLRRNTAAILSPFDNLLIQRERMRALFDFDYQIECYVPAAKRQHGYFCLPVLWDGRLVARLDCKAQRKTGLLAIHQLSLENNLKKLEPFAAALSKELHHFLAFNNCQRLAIDKVSPSAFKALLKQHLVDLL